MSKQFYVYILASISKTLYTGVTNNLERRIDEHRKGTASQFTSRYNISRLVYFETSGDIVSAIAREKQIKAWTRGKRVALIEVMNPEWQDLSKTLLCI